MWRTRPIDPACRERIEDDMESTSPFDAQALAHIGARLIYLSLMVTLTCFMDCLVLYVPLRSTAAVFLSRSTVEQILFLSFANQYLDSLQIIL